jgi:hypothetical protein
MAEKKKPSKSVYSDIAKKAETFSDRVKRGATDGEYDMASGGIARSIGYAAKDLFSGKPLGRSAYEDKSKELTASYRKEALMNKAKDERKAKGQAEANKRYKATGNYGR